MFLLDGTTTEKEFSSFGSGLELFGLILLCIIIIAASYFVTKLIAGKQIKQHGESNFKVIDTYRVTQNKVIQLLKVGEKYIVIAICKDTISLLTELTEEQIILHKEGNGQGKNFKDILSGFVKKKDTMTEKVDTHDDNY